MHISLDWISDYVDLSGIAPEEIAEKLTLATAEVEGFEILKRSIAGVLVGEVTSVEPIATEGGKKLTFCEVDCGGKKYTTVCGAPNVRVGLKAAFAPAGTKLAGGVEIAETEMTGRKSQGILCSAAELGMSQWHEVLLECPAEIASGTLLSKFIPDEDVLIEIDNKSLTHRPDLWGHYGFARELAAVFRKPLKPLPTTDLSQYDKLPRYDLKINDLDGCPCYACIEFNVEASRTSPLVMQRRLHALGQRTYNLMVDVTNYCMLDLGQPTHAFDASRLSAVRIGPLGKPGTFITLDDQQRKMNADDLFIWNEKEPVALAGIMGGQNSEVAPETTSVLLESANFNAARVRRTSVRLGLRSDAAQRFEKSQPPANTKVAIARILELIADSGAKLEVTCALTVDGDPKESFRTIELPPGSLDAMAGEALGRDEVTSILESLGYTAEYKKDDTLVVGVPPYRSEKDISIVPDIAEEVMRVYGFGRIHAKMPSMPLKTLHVEKPIRIEHKARRMLAGSHRFIEVHNYGWTDDNWLSALGFEPENTIALRNPAVQSCNRMRTTLLPNLLALVGKNRTHRDAFRLFELGHIYINRKTPTGRHKNEYRDELPRLAGISFQQSPQPSLEEHFRSIKGAIEDLAIAVNGPAFTFEPSYKSLSPWQSADLWVEIRQGESVIGALGVLDKKALQTVSPEGGQVVWFEIEMDKLQGDLYPSIQFQPAPKFPGSWQDFSLMWEIDRGYSELVHTLDRFSHPLVMGRDFLYDYKDKGKEYDLRLASYTFRYWIGSPEQTLTGDDIEGFQQALFKFLAAEKIKLRHEYVAEIKKAN